MKMETRHSAGKSNVNRQETSLTIILFGKTGNGKSSVGNTILSTGTYQELFPVGGGLASTSVEIKTIYTYRERETIEVIDITDFTNLDQLEVQARMDIESFKTQVSRTPHVILLAIRCDVRYTKEEYDIYREFQAIWGGRIRDHLIVAFTFGDRQDHDIKDDLKKANSELKSVLRDAEQRYVVFNDKDAKHVKDRVVEELLRKIQKMQSRETTRVVRQSGRGNGCCICNVL